MSKYTVPAILMALLGATLPPKPGRAQELIDPAARQGYFLSTGLRVGAGFGDADGVGNLGTLSHFGLLVRAGQKPLPWLGLGLRVGGGSDGNDTWTLGTGLLMLEVQIEPLPINLAIRGAIGAAGGTISRAQPFLELPDDPSFLFGSAYTLGLSYDWFPFYNAQEFQSGGGALSLFVEGRYVAGGDVNIGGVFVGLEFTWWTGLNRRKLRLPINKAFR